MLFELSTSTATTFCCGRSVATLSAGCHSRNSSSATMPVSSSQMAMGRAPESMPWLRRTCQKSAAGGGDYGERQHPQGPRRQENKLAFMKQAGRIFEQKFEHGKCSRAGCDECVDALRVGWELQTFPVARNGAIAAAFGELASYAVRIAWRGVRALPAVTPQGC